MESKPKLNKTDQGTGTGIAMANCKDPIRGAKVDRRDYDRSTLADSQGPKDVMDPVPSQSLISDSRTGTGKAMSHSQTWDEKPDVVPSADRGNRCARILPRD